MLLSVVVNERPSRLQFCALQGCAGRGVTVADEHHVSKSGDQGKGIDQVEHKTSDRPPFLLSCQCGPSTQSPVNSPMVRSKPRAQPKKKPPVDDKAEPIEETLTVAPAPLFSTGDAVHHPMFGDGKVESIKENKLTITFDGNVTKVIREDFVTRKK